MRISSGNNRWLVVAVVVFVALVGTVTPTQQAEAQSGGWERGCLVGLRANTCIREGPGYGFRAHTRVPEDNWTVKVIDGPRTANGKVWWDTSRKAAGDPSGGTGWVTQEQDDMDCASSNLAQNPPIPNPQPPISPALPSQPATVDLLDFSWLASLWRGLPALAKWTLVVVALLCVPALWRLIGGKVMHLIGAMLLALVLWIVADSTRDFWSDTWASLGNTLFGAERPDLALLLASVPLVGWALSILRSAIWRR
jgi:hypothetical protein